MMIIKKENGKTVIDFKNEMLHTYNDIALDIPNEDIGEKLEIRNLHVYGRAGYSQLNFIEKVKLLGVVFKTIFFK